MAHYRIVNRIDVDPVAARAALVAQLRAYPASIPPKYFYDALGCALFGAICELPEYYLPRAERAVFAAHQSHIVEVIGSGGQWVDLGAGDCRKGEAWLTLVAARRYVAVDIAESAIDAALARLAPRFPDVEMVGIVADFTRGLDLYADLVDLPTTFFYPGSSIGNFAPDESLGFLQVIRRHCLVPGSGLLIGVDTKKDSARLDAAYADPLGVTAAFNRNVLHHVNRVLGSDFMVAEYAHVGVYNAEAGRIEMHLEAISSQAVMLDGKVRTFAAGERIHTENSYKYAPAEFGALLVQAGFGTVRCWQDADGDFAVFHAA
jgi:dimethylhistidine N-methyltransferase